MGRDWPHSTKSRASSDRGKRCAGKSGVILFGSFAEGRAVPGSDLEIMIVLARDERPFPEWVSAYLTYFSGIGIGVDLFPYTVSSLSNPLARQAAEKGPLLFSR